MDEARVLRGAIGRTLVDNAAYRIFLEIRRRGITADEIREWQGTTFFPWLRDAPELNIIGERLKQLLPFEQGDRLAETQILLRFPDEDGVPIVGTPHVDELPPWAPEGASYRWIAGVALNEAYPGNGAFFADGKFVYQQAGDVLVFPGDLPHSGSANTSGEVRASLYYRCVKM